MTVPDSDMSRWRQWLHGSYTWVLVVVLTVGLTAALAFNPVQSDVQVTEGEAAVANINAPEDLVYTSDVLTAQRRQEARIAIEEQYTPLDLSIGRNQLNLARAIFAYIDTVRADTQATQQTKLDYLQEITGLTIEEAVGLALLELNDTDYVIAKTDILGIIDVLMRQEIRDTQLSDARRTARRQVSLELTTLQNTVVTNLAPQFVVETVFVNPEATAVLRDEAETAVTPVVRDIQQGQRILSEGDIVTDLDIEVLTALGLMQRDTNWRDIGRLFLVSLLSAVILTLYWQQYHRRRQENLRYVMALASLVIFFALVGRLMQVGSPLLAYWFPLAAMSMLISVIFDIRLAMVTTAIMATIFGFVGTNSLELAMYAGAGGMLATLVLRDAQRITAFFRAGLIASIGYMLVIIMFRFTANVDTLAMVQLLLYALANGILSAGLTLAGFYLLGSTFGITTTLQLQDLSRLDHPLLQELLRRAPGTYHHSIMVANLAEQAAEMVPSADSTMVRVGAFYHDIGKMNRPPFFTENQEGLNPHDTLDPYSSARIILSHVTDGVEMARKYRLPDRIRDFIAEHHGDRVVMGFYHKALAESEDGAMEVDMAKFQYGGPRPRSPETGIVMLADSVEATSSALRPNTARAIEKLVNSLVDDHLMGGQLDDAALTMGDIKMIRESFIKTLKGRFHVRVKYKGNEELVDESGDVAEPKEDKDTAVAPKPASASSAADETLPGTSLALEATMAATDSPLAEAGEP